MSLENEIKKLRESIESFTTVFVQSTKPIIHGVDVAEPVCEYRKPIQGGPYEDVVVADNVVVSMEVAEVAEVAEEEVIEEKAEAVEEKKAKKAPVEADTDKITLKDVKDLTKDKMAAGVDRKKLKEIVISIKEDASLDDLNEAELEQAYNQMKEVKND